MPKVIDAEQFQKDVLDNKGVVLVDFFATWCGPCKMLTPILENLAPEFEGKIPIYKVDIDAQQQLAAKYRVMSVPTMKVFKDGEVVETIVGLQPESVLKAKLDYYAQGAA